MSGQFTIESERDNLAAGLPEAERPGFTALVEQAVAQARAANLTAAAATLDDARRQLVAHEHFRRCDNDIWSFDNLLSLIRGESPETAVPRAYQRMMDSAPSGRIDEKFSRAQNEFWYGKAEAETDGVLMVGTPDELRRELAARQAPPTPPAADAEEEKVTFWHTLGGCVGGLFILAWCRDCWIESKYFQALFFGLLFGIPLTLTPVMWFYFRKKK